jgi:hypothetical protein
LGEWCDGELAAQEEPMSAIMMFMLRHHESDEAVRIYQISHSSERAAATSSAVIGIRSFRASGTPFLTFTRKVLPLTPLQISSEAASPRDKRRWRANDLRTISASGRRFNVVRTIKSDAMMR